MRRLFGSVQTEVNQARPNRPVRGSVLRCTYNTAKHARTDGELHERPYGGPHPVHRRLALAPRQKLPRRQHQDGRPQPELREVVQRQVRLGRRQPGAAAAPLLAHASRGCGRVVVYGRSPVCVADEEEG